MSTGPTCQLSFQKSYRTNKILIVCVSLNHLRLFFSKIIISKNILNNYYYYYRSVSQLPFDLSISMDSLSSLHWPLPSPSLDILPFFCFFSSRLLPCLNNLNSSSTNISMKSPFYLYLPPLRAADELSTFATQFV